MWLQRQVPTHALFLWTYSGPWIAHSWLSELLIYGLMRTGGEAGGPVIALATVSLMSFASFALLWMRCRVDWLTLGSALIPFILAIDCAGERFMPRPEIFSTLMFAVLMRVLLTRDANVADKTSFPVEHRVRAVGLALLFVVWTNLHGAVLNGVVALWSSAIVELFQYRNARARRGVLVAAMCTLATLVNPYGYHYYRIYRAVGTLTFSQIPEWRPLLQSPNMPPTVLAALGLLVAASLYVWWRTPGRRWSHLVWVVIFALLTLAARRNIIYLTLACLAPVTVYFGGIAAGQESPGLTADRVANTGRRLRGRRPPVDKPFANAPTRRRWAAAMSSVAIAVYVYAVWTPLAIIRVNGLRSTATLASGLAAAVKSCGITGRVFNDYDYGAYLDWELAGTPPLFIDNMNAYPDSVERDYDDIMQADQRGMAILDAERVDCVIGRRPVPFDPEFPQLYVTLSESPEWALAYFGGDGPVWVRRVPQYRPIWSGVPVFTGHNMDDFMNYLHNCPRIVGEMRS